MIGTWRDYLRFRPEIAELLDPRCYAIEWLDEQVVSGAAIVFTSDTAVILVEIKAYPAGAREVHGLVAAGDLAAILPLIDEAEAWGLGNGCIFAGIASRAGWGRVLRDRGYQPYQIELRKELFAHGHV